MYLILEINNIKNFADSITEIKEKRLSKKDSWGVRRHSKRGTFYAHWITYTS